LFNVIENNNTINNNISNSLYNDEFNIDNNIDNNIKNSNTNNLSFSIENNNTNENNLFSGMKSNNIDNNRGDVESLNKNRKIKRKNIIGNDDDDYKIENDECNSEDESTKKRRKKHKISSEEKKEKKESKKNIIKKTQSEIAEKPYDCFLIYSKSEKTFRIQNNIETIVEDNKLVTLSIEFKNYFINKINDINENIYKIKKAVFELCCILFYQLQNDNNKFAHFPQQHEIMVKKFLKDIGCFTPQCRRFTYHAIEAFYIGFLNTYLKQNTQYQSKFDLHDFCENQYFSENNNNVIYQFVNSCDINSIIQLIVVLQCKLTQLDNSGFICASDINGFKSKCVALQLILCNNFLSDKNNKIRIFRNLEEIKKTKKEEEKKRKRKEIKKTRK
jgi:hypothetical protein